MNQIKVSPKKLLHFSKDLRCNSSAVGYLCWALYSDYNVNTLVKRCLQGVYKSVLADQLLWAGSYLCCYCFV